ncbi:hypothetical protein [Streptomyces sp. TRM68367]|uniref:hypothetical protein n=1 Tax=Streptomyces sp. TRM68367 TaxID=2758415 RepID=UPI00165C9E7C|nr:hypothetical protein [Streptomyces sp. TRM68367]MBC9727062.1 hypothetical protein [Streptomyces sp. TRM68367]
MVAVGTATGTMSALGEGRGSDEARPRVTRSPTTLDALAVEPSPSPSVSTSASPSPTAEKKKGAHSARTLRADAEEAQHQMIGASWRERALNTEEALKAAHAEIANQRERIAELLGQIAELLGHQRLHQLGPRRKALGPHLADRRAGDRAPPRPAGTAGLGAVVHLSAAAIEEGRACPR